MYALFNENFSSVLEIGQTQINKTSFTLGDVSRNVEFLINTHQLNKLRFKETNICVMNSSFSLIPEAYAVNESSKLMLQFSSGVGEKVKNAYNVKFNQVNFSYSIEQELLLTLEKTFKNATVRHAGAVSINLLFSNSSLKSCDLLVNYHPGVFELVAKRNNSLLYYNVFNYETNEDVLYYLLFMMEQYDLNPLTTKLAIAGELDADSDLCKSVKKYIRHVNFAVNDKSFNTSFGQLKLPDHYFFSLTNQHLCEL